MTWDRDKELDRVSVTMERELSLGHGAVGDEGAGDDSVLAVSVHSDWSSRSLARLDHVLDQVAGAGLDQVRRLERNTDDHSVPSSQPQSVARDMQGCDPHK